MSHVYRGAESVVLLGPANDNSHVILDAFEITRAIVKMPVKAFDEVEFVNTVLTDEIFVKSMLHLLNREYWTRV